MWKEIHGKAGEIYQYMGPIAPTLLNLNGQDYSDLGFWKPLAGTQLVPQGLNITPSDSVAIGGLVVLNQVESRVDAYIDSAVVTAGSVKVAATNESVIRATTDNTSSSSGGDVWGKGESLAATGVLSTNVVQGGAAAYITGSTITTTGGGDLSVRALNVSQIDATTKSASTSGANSYSFLLAFNTIGWRAQNVLFNTVDAILGDPLISNALGNSQPDGTEAYIHDSKLDVSGAISVQAVDRSQINSLVSNMATSAPSAFFGAAGMSASGALSSNRVNSHSTATIDYSAGYTHVTSGGHDVKAGGSILVLAEDDAGIQAETSLFASVSPNNDAGSGILNNFANQLLDQYQYTSASGVQNVKFGDKVRVADDYYTPAYTTNGDSQPVSLTTGQFVQLTDDFAGSHGIVGALYKYVGPSGMVDVGITNYDDTSMWQQMGNVYQWMGTDQAGLGLNLGTQDYSDFEHWKKIDATHEILDSVPYTLLGEVGTRFEKEGLTGDSNSFYGLIDYNDVRSQVTSTIASVVGLRTGADLTVEATDIAQIVAVDTSDIQPWTGVGGAIVTNTILSSAQASISKSDVTALGNVSVFGFDYSLIDATAESTIEAWDSKSAVVAFNAIGWNSQNIFFNAFDALIGDPVANAGVSGANPAQVLAFIVDSNVNATGDIQVDAEAAAQINATVGNENVSDAEVDLVFNAKRASQKADFDAKKKPGGSKVDGYGASGVAGGGVLASNKVNSNSQAYISFTGARGTIQAGGAVLVSGRDDSGINSNSKVVQDTTTANTAAGIVDVVNSLLVPDDYVYTTASGPRVLEVGDRVRLGASYANGGDAGAVYKFIGIPTGLPVDLGTISYATADWEKVVGAENDLSNFYPGIGNFTASDARSIGILIILNDVRGSVEAYIDNATVSAGNNIASDYLSTDTPASLTTGQRVQVSPGVVYEYIGVDVLDSPDLSDGAQKYATNSDWKLVRAIDVEAVENATLVATAEMNVSASGGSYFGTGTVWAGSGQLVTNLVLSSAKAYIQDSDVSTTGGGDVQVLGIDSSLIDATILCSTSSGDTAGSLTLAFNTIGWKSQNFLFNTIDAILGDPLISSAFHGEQPAEVDAFILNSYVHIGGDLSVLAFDNAELDATLSNASSSQASALHDANGKSIGGAVASNKVASTANAYIDTIKSQYSSTDGTKTLDRGDRVKVGGLYYQYLGNDGDSVNLGATTYTNTSLWKPISYLANVGITQVTGDLTVQSQDNAGIYANSKIVSSSITTNDGGASLIQSKINAFLPADFQSDETSATIHFGDRVRLMPDFATADYSSTDGEQPVTNGSIVQLADNYATSNLTTSAGFRLVVPGDQVQVADGYDAAKGTVGEVYVYVGPRDRLNLSDQDYTDTSLWQKVAGTAGSLYRYVGGAQTLDLGSQDYTDTSLWAPINGVPGSVYEYMGTTRSGVNLSNQDYTDLGFWKQVPETQIIPQGYNVASENPKNGDSDAMGLGGLIVVNDVRSYANAYIDHSTVTSASLDVSALEQAVIKADVDTAAIASGGSAFGDGNVIAVNGTIATNQVLSKADAHVANSRITTTSGDVNVTGQNISQIDATTKSATTSGDTGVGITLAFNSMGWRPQNVLFNTVDALIGDPVIAGAFGNDKVPAEVDAYILNSVVDSAGALNVTADSAAQLNATVSNEATSVAVALKGATSKAVGGILASNLVNSKANAYISYGNSYVHAVTPDVHAAGALTVLAQDDAEIDSNATIDVLASSKNDFGIGALTKVALSFLNDYQYTTKSGPQDVHTGDMVRVSDDYSPALGDPGKFYRFLGDDAAGKGLDLGTTNFKNAAIWIELDLTNPLDILPNSFTNVTASGAIAVGGLVVRNDVRSDVESWVNNATVSADGPLSIQALETAKINAVDTSTVKSDGGSVFGKSGNSVAVNGVIATNLVLSHAVAYASNSNLTTTGSNTITVDAENTSAIDAEITNKTTANGTAVGVTLAFNTIGWDAQNILFNTVDALVGTNIGTEDPASTQAYLSNTDVHAGGGLTVSATSNASINASIDSAARVLAANVGSDDGSTKGITVDAVLAMNRLSTRVKAYIDGGLEIESTTGDIGVSATDLSAINASVNTSSMAIAVSGSEAISVAVGISLSRNQIDNDLAAYMNNVTDVTAHDGDVSVTGSESASIDSTSTATAISLALSLDSKSVGVSGGGATALNEIQGNANAYVSGSSVTAHDGGSGQGSISVTTEDMSTINADVEALAAALAGGVSGFTPGVAIGFSLARNLIGWTLYSGSTPFDVLAYTSDTSLTADHEITVESTSTANINAVVAATAVAVALAGTTGLALSAGGLWTDNKIAINGQARIDGSSKVQSNGKLKVSATDASSITADARATSISASLAGETGGSIAVGLSLAHNTIGNQVEAYINDASSVTTGGHDVEVSASEDATIKALSVAVAVAVGVSGETGFAISAGGAESTNIILTHTDAYVKDSAIGTSLKKVGGVSVTATSNGLIDAFVGSVAASVSFGGENGIGAAIGVSVARNFIGWDPSNTPSSTTYTTGDHPSVLTSGNTVAIETGARSGDVYQYLGPTLTNASYPIDLTTQDYSNHDLWKQIGLTRVGSPIQAYIQNSSVDASGALIVSATSTQSIDAKVLAGSVALAAGGEVGVALSGAGVYTENRIGTDVKAYIDGDGATGIRAGSISLSADDSSGISAIAGAASVAGSVGGEAGVGISIGLAIAINEVSNQVYSFIANADNEVKSTSGDVSVSATTHGQPVFDLSAGTFSPSALNSAADNGTLSTLNALAIQFASHGQALPITNTVSHASNYVTSDGSQAIKVGETVYLPPGYSHGGTAGAVYKYTGPVLTSGQTINLSTANYGDASKWTVVLSFRLTTLSAGKSWSLTSGDGTTYVLTFDSTNNVIHVSKSTINVVSAAASVALTFGGTAGIAISGAGAVAQNEVLSKTDAYVDSSTVSSAGSASILATSTSGITAVVAAVSVAVGGGGEAGVGASIGVAVAQNFIGYHTDGSKSAAEVMAYGKDSSIHATNSLTIHATSSQSIDTIVLSGSAAVGAAGAVGIAASGSGVYSENEIGVNTKAYIDGDGSLRTPGIQASSIDVLAQDSSQISAVAGAVSLGAAFAGSVSVAVSVGVALAHNRIDSEVAAYLANADNMVKTTSGAISVQALETASIDVIAAAASLAVAIGGDFGGAISGAGAEATNVILTGVNAYVSGSILDSAGAVTLNASNSASIHALIVAASVSAGVGTVGIGASIGIALARNDIGWDPNTTQAYDYTSDQTLAGGLTYGKRVKIKKGVSEGDVYEYVGPTIIVFGQAEDGRLQ